MNDMSHLGYYTCDSQNTRQKKGLPELPERAIICPQFTSGRSAVRLARLHGVQEVPGSTPGAPTCLSNKLFMEL
jgi:hypothetical protein